MDPDGLLVIGYGSSLRADDAAGTHAARTLARFGFDSVEAHQLTPELAERIAQARQVIFIDAHTEVAPGQIAVKRVEAGTAAGVLEHHGSPEGIMRLAQEAFGAAPQAWLIGLGGRNFDFGDGLSRAARSAVWKAVSKVLNGSLCA